MPLLVLYNPVCGDGTAQQFFNEHVLPLIASSGKVPDKIAATDRAGHSGAIVADFLASAKSPATVVLGSGDGTLHEIINVLNSRPLGDTSIPRVSFSLVPCGTANALYSSLFPPSDDDDPLQYKLRSVRAFLSPSPTTVPLNLAITTLSPAPTRRTPLQSSISVVVASTALHASILHDSESLRASDPSMERFKTAALINITLWYNATVKLFPVQTAGVVQLYDPAECKFVAHPQSTQSDPIVDLEGPFAYFLSTVNVDRLEPAFKITPLTTRTRGEVYLDVVIVRPLRDPTSAMDSEATRHAFAAKAGTVLGAAYQNGAHIALRYAQDGSVVSDGDGPTVVEYIRCGGWEWEPDDTDNRAHLVCADGDILTIEQGGKASCLATAPKNNNAGFAVFI
ncbi:Sphingosine kinase 1 [Grifola frondosa]|uniref:Sphingosine kinase 1 n=1 Tax=Grifola frondosa TaxID=5627 RepID=A0A1C7MHB6_GRIFR|nr:Sphingosine kinase 1 [Grifola frondosa]